MRYPRLFDGGTSARPDPQLAKQQPANGLNDANGEEFENTSILQNADEDLDGDSCQEREDRAKPGHAPLVRPVAGHGCVSWNTRLTEADRCSLAEAEIGRATQTASVAKISMAR